MSEELVLIKIPTFDEMMNPLLQALQKEGGSANNEKLVEGVAREMGLSEEQLSVLHSGRDNMSEVAYRLAWTRTYLRKYGLIENVGRAVWALTETGKSLKRVDPDDVKRVVRQIDGGTDATTAQDPATLTRADGDVRDSADRPDHVRSLTPHLPTYQEAAHFLRVLDGVPYELYRDTYNEIWSQRGTPQDQMDWSEPEQWISMRLEGEQASLALRIWRESQGQLNPRYSRGAWYFSQTHELLVQDSQGVLRITEKGHQFLARTSVVVVAIDRYEGILALMSILETLQRGKRSDIMPAWTNFCQRYSRYESESSMKSALANRLNNLIARAYIQRNQYTYEMTPAGIDYLGLYREQVEPFVSTVATTTPTEQQIQGRATPPSGDTRSLTPGLPTNEEARHFLRSLNGVPYALYRSTYNEIWEHRGSPQDQVDWSDPDDWITARLTGEEAVLAKRIWRESKGELNPRYLRGSWYLTTKHDLLAEDAQRILRITERGENFLEHPTGEIVAKIDSFEGILTVLRLVAERGPGKRSDFLPEYAEFCRAYTGYQSETPIRGSLYDRLTNLIAREYISRSGQVYEVTDAGLSYLERYGELVPGQPRKTQSKQAELRRLAREIRQEARSQLAAYLAEMDPFKFEELVRFLLEEMGYRDVETTSPVNDKGVDVIADIDLGISSVREVVQVKRRRGNIGRVVLDQLRGSLHRFNAVRGTIITTGGFSRGTIEAAFERGAAPITLIDGAKLVELLIEHGIGVSKQPVEYLEFDPEKLPKFDDKEGEENELGEANELTQAQLES